MSDLFPSRLFSYLELPVLTRNARCVTLRPRLSPVLYLNSVDLLNGRPISLSESLGFLSLSPSLSQVETDKLPSFVSVQPPVSMRRKFQYRPDGFGAAVYL